MSRKREIFLQALDQPVKARSAFVERTTAVGVEMVFQANSPARAVGARVTFEPGARTAWHTHSLGQTLIVTDGVGWVQREGGPVEEVHAGDVVWFSPGEKHWHGASELRNSVGVTPTTRRKTCAKWLGLV